MNDKIKVNDMRAEINVLRCQLAGEKEKVFELKEQLNECCHKYYKLFECLKEVKKIIEEGNK